jgi:phage baseplate assembly protein W
MNEKAFLGVGWKFPIEVDEVTGRIKTSSYEDDIKEAIYIIIGTAKGERIMNREFGCDINKYVFENFSYNVATRMENCVKEALQRWEPRIVEVDVKAEQDSNNNAKVNLNISYVVRSTNNPYNLVYPFYLNEGI